MSSRCLQAKHHRWKTAGLGGLNAGASGERQENSLDVIIYYRNITKQNVLGFYFESFITPQLEEATLQISLINIELLWFVHFWSETFVGI